MAGQLWNFGDALMRSMPLNARLALDADGSDEIEIVLIKITHEALAAPVRLSTDPTERLTVDPLAYGTRSSWLTANPAADPFLFVLLSAMVPDDKKDAPAAATLTLEAVDNEVAKLLRSTTERARVDMAVVLASNPNELLFEQLDMRLINAEGSADSVTLQISRDPITAEPWPGGRMTRARFPGLHA